MHCPHTQFCFMVTCQSSLMFVIYLAHAFYKLPLQEIPEEHGGSGMNFTSALLAVEELSRVDPSVSIMVDIHNTLSNNAVRFWGSPDLQAKWLPDWPPIRYLALP